MFSLSSLTLAVNITYLSAYPLGDLTKHLNCLNILLSEFCILALYIKKKNALVF